MFYGSKKSAKQQLEKSLLIWIFFSFYNLEK
ncbi:hypothetical protein E4N77_07445 [Treponema denticola]|nr:hypothetical protein E4N77_07445 [Treponema denticola]